ncbi:MAG: hypothetical protein GEV05_28615 [Betaproteobacteria bacterium]|nr:hypothetical protein [Betaproteobacteria bacterium]
MTAVERTELSRLVRLRAKVAKTDVDAMAAQRLANVERELAAKYGPQEQAWAALVRETERKVQAADAELEVRCQDLGIRGKFRPSLHFYWSSRGENAILQRRTELRRVAQAEIESRVRQAKATIDKVAAGQLTQLAAGALSSEEARAFLKSMPAIEQLLPAVVVAALEDKSPPRP